MDFLDLQLSNSTDILTGFKRKEKMIYKLQHRQTNFSLQKAILFLLILLLLPASGFAAEKSYIIGFNKKPEKIEKDHIKNAKGKITRSFNRINAMVVTLSDEGFEKLKKDKKKKKHFLYNRRQDVLRNRTSTG